MWSAQAVHELKINHTQRHLICLAWNPKHVIVQWVGSGTHTHTFMQTISPLLHTVLQDSNDKH